MTMILEGQAMDISPLLPGSAALGFYAAHLWHWTRERKLENALWACHLGCLFVGLGWVATWPMANAVGLLWLIPGIFLWSLYLIGGGLFMWTSLLIHAGGNLLGIWGVIRFGIPAGVWWRAGLGFVALLLLSRRVSRESENVNFSIKVWTGWEGRFPSYRRYVAGLVLGAFALFFALEQILRAFLGACP